MQGDTPDIIRHEGKDRRFFTPKQVAALFRGKNRDTLSSAFHRLGWKASPLPRSETGRKLKGGRIFGWICPGATEDDIAALREADLRERGDEIRAFQERVARNRNALYNSYAWRKKHHGEPHPHGGFRRKAEFRPLIEKAVAQGRMFVTPSQIERDWMDFNQRNYVRGLMIERGWTRVRLPSDRRDRRYAVGWLRPGFTQADIAELKRADYGERGTGIELEAQRRLASKRLAYKIDLARKKKRAAEARSKRAPSPSRPPKAAERIRRISQLIGDRRFVTRGLLSEILPDDTDRQYFITYWERVAGWRVAATNRLKARNAAEVPLVMLAPNATEADLEAAFLQDIAERGTGNWLWYLPRLCRAWAKGSCADLFHGTAFRTP